MFFYILINKGNIYYRLDAKFLKEILKLETNNDPLMSK